MAQNFVSELSRANARSDAEQLRRILARYHAWDRSSAKEEELADDDELGAWFDLDLDAERTLAAVMIAAAEYDDPHLLMMVAVGPLENVLADPPPDILDRLLVEARKTARLRWMLQMPYPHAMSAAAWAAIGPLIAGLKQDDPLPPPPWD